MRYEADSVDVIVVGGGHAGCEAALASARMGLKTIMFAINLDSVAMMPCNPSIGGSSKGHLVREVDALGGEMGKNIDKTYIQTKMLNTGKGPAVYSLRAQADKNRYKDTMKATLENTENLTIRQNEVTEILVEDGKVVGVVTHSDAVFRCKAVVLCMGTYMKSRCLYGETIMDCGPNGLMNSTKLSQNLMDLGIKLYRFKTGTPARIDRRTVDFSKMEPQYGDEKIVPFSFENKPEDIYREQIPCWLTYTNEETHNIIRENLHRSPMYAGVIEGTGARYCPSIEDKVTRFADKNRHQIFIEPEGENTHEMYVQGMSTSLPEDVQLRMYRSVPGLENCEIMRTAYAIEYDCIDATQLKLSLEFKDIKGLFSAGQFNGTSGYEEAAAQGIIGGINAVQYVKGKEPLILKRSDAYIGVLIDDIVTKGSKEPYRMMTSRAEYRLLLRQDNADQRLTKLGYEVGLVTEERYQRLLEKERLVAEEIERVQSVIVSPKEETLELLEKYGSTPIKSGVRLSELIKRPELDYYKLKPIDKKRPENLDAEVEEQVNIQIKYEGYIKQQLNQVEQFKKLENRLLPEDMDYSTISGLRIEAQQKLNAMRPASIGHASRIAGVSPADISVLLVYMEQMKRSN
ncbi:MAG: tRNA uridine-5-carboxymethylaminomethyl(34) synthesis enzyme MnmG [Tyzzerella sp.]|uniref:tRNA uridine 5-carboxymethylaminomethyl modification enzyme MnmG n=1 Tax=Candidatus Fimicola merdigallinarum TaxID=2840819 RepID=A0A9D9H578_9FIRM|nr:tRNA uridine-5-carboxymethylaminomethyl(34) synthesis enzyme MnmG [Candidatus Fimicola merdigallinarum]